MKKALIIFVRNPEAGKVKTRLAATIGAEAALFVYKKLLAHTHAVVAEMEVEKFVFYADQIKAKDIWDAPHFHKQVQVGNTLGERMAAAFELVLNLGFKQVVIMGSDCPELDAELLQAAYKVLDEKDAVIGPAKDGGYYLLGLKKLHTALFTNKQWSTASVFKDTVHTLQQLSLQYGVLPTLSDVDTAQDLPPAWQAEIKSLFNLA